MSNTNQLTITAGTIEIQKKLSVSQGRKLYAAVLELGSKNKEDLKAFAAWMKDFAGEEPMWFDHVQVALGQICIALAKKTFHPASPETLAWGGFLGGETFTDNTPAQEWLNEFLSKHSNDIDVSTKFPFELIEGQLFTSSNNWPQKWERKYYRVLPCCTKAQLVATESFWCSVRGNFESHIQDGDIVELTDTNFSGRYFPKKAYHLPEA